MQQQRLHAFLHAHVPQQACLDEMLNLIGQKHGSRARSMYRSKDTVRASDLPVNYQSDVCGGRRVVLAHVESLTGSAAAEVVMMVGK